MLVASLFHSVSVRGLPIKRMTNCYSLPLAVNARACRYPWEMFLSSEYNEMNNILFQFLSYLILFILLRFYIPDDMNDDALAKNVITCVQFSIAFFFSFFLIYIHSLKHAYVYTYLSIYPSSQPIFVTNVRVCA